VENGKLPKSALAPIPGGELAKDAAAAWNAPGGPADAGLRPTGSQSSYRTYDEQVALYKLYQEGRGNLAAVPGTSNHGWGVAVDLAETWMRTWMDEHGAAFGWRKTEAFSEWWHVNYDGSKHFPTFETLKRGSKGKRVKHFTKRLAFIHRPNGAAYLKRAPGRYGKRVEVAVGAFQLNHDLRADGEIGPKTAAKIDAVFHRQYRERHKAQPRGQHR
jgi:peptidoglycan hydrolase-like protein with peptidoglycan-binding domain